MEKLWEGGLIFVRMLINQMSAVGLISLSLGEVVVHILVRLMKVLAT